MAVTVLRFDAAPGASTWMRDHMDHHVAALTSSAGPFAHLDDRSSAKDGGLPHEARPGARSSTSAPRSVAG